MFDFVPNTSLLSNEHVAKRLLHTKRGLDVLYLFNQSTVSVLRRASSHVFEDNVLPYLCNYSYKVVLRFDSMVVKQ